MMLISSVKAYEYGDVSIVAPLLTLTTLTNTIYEYFIDKNKQNFIYKLVVSILILIGVILIKLKKRLLTRIAVKVIIIIYFLLVLLSWVLMIIFDYLIL